MSTIQLPASVLEDYSWWFVPLKSQQRICINWTYMCDKYVLINPDMNSSLSTHDDHGAHTHTGVFAPGSPIRCPPRSECGGRLLMAISSDTPPWHPLSHPSHSLPRHTFPSQFRFGWLTKCSFSAWFGQTEWTQNCVIIIHLSKAFTIW